jgi:excinuclease ABC subunit A
VVVDRLTVKASPSAPHRLGRDGAAARRRPGRPRLRRPPDDDPERERTFPSTLACLYDDLSFEELEPRSFSFNSPIGPASSATASAPARRSTPSSSSPTSTASFEQGRHRHPGAAVTTRSTSGGS